MHVAVSPPTLAVATCASLETCLLAGEWGLKNYPNVKPPRLFAKCHGVRTPALARGMLLHPRRPLHHGTIDPTCHSHA